MRYIDEKRLRIGYLIVFGLSTALAIGAYWDVAYNEQALVKYYLGGLGAMLVIAFMFYLGTELILKDAVQVMPVAEATPGPKAEPEPDAGSMSRRSNRAREREKRPAPSPGPAPAPAPSPVPAWAHAAAAPPPTHVEIHIRTPTDVLVAGAEPPPGSAEEPHEIPKPAAVPVVVSPRRQETIALELGDPFAPWVPPPRRTETKDRAIESTRVLCGACGTYFRIQTDAGRPQQVPCPRCEKPLVISGHQRMEPHLHVRCRSCGEALFMPKMHEVSALQCATCGQFSEIRSPASAAKFRTSDLA